MKMGSNFVTVSLPIVAATLSSSPIVTNAGNRSRERMGTMIQADLRELGIALVTLDFPSLIQRIRKLQV